MDEIDEKGGKVGGLFIIENAEKRRLVWCGRCGGGGESERIAFIS